jgi:hypothetical protein
MTTRRRYDGNAGLLFSEQQYKLREALRRWGIELRRANSLAIGHRQPDGDVETFVYTKALEEATHG